MVDILIVVSLYWVASTSEEKGKVPNVFCGDGPCVGYKFLLLICFLTVFFLSTWALFIGHRSNMNILNPCVVRTLVVLICYE